MSSFDFPKYQANQEVGNTGEAFFEHFVTKELGCIYRKVHRRWNCRGLFRRYQSILGNKFCHG
ncbi:Uncharacterised protein [Vibrio cholerae]|nr:Uncharacterised protein [Vibrio cholerae]